MQFANTALAIAILVTIGIYIFADQWQDPFFYYQNQIINEIPPTKPPKKGYLSIEYRSVERSGLCNKLFELLSAIGMAETLNRRPYFPLSNKGLQKLAYNVRPLFPKLEDQFKIVSWEPIKVKYIAGFQNGCCYYNRSLKLMQNYADEFLQLGGRYFQSFKYFDHKRTEIREWLHPNQEIQDLAEQNCPQKFRDHFIVCVHIRRGDFKSDPFHAASDGPFATLTLDYLMEKYRKTNKKVAGAILGDDRKWSKETFKDRPNVFVAENSVEQEFAFTRRYCNAMLITAPSSTFGWFMGYLSKGFEVYYKDPYSSKDVTAQQIVEEDFFLPSWIKLRLVNGKVKKFEKNSRKNPYE